MRHQIWRAIGWSGFWLLLPLIIVYARITKPRTRVLLVHDNHVLVVKNWLGTGHWSLPGGGIDAHESPQQAAIREIKEELGLDIETGALRPLGLHLAHERGGLMSKYHLFAVELMDRPELSLKTNEIMDAEWRPVTDVSRAEKGVTNTVKQSVEVWSQAQNLVS